ncbi:MAG: Holliday junction branch migration protein RuvA [Candidatus Margulisbacteria bacterium]|jgi:Holliday junction DNA helicase RuvA|nr:Holliday junction branch migration protein RuvA [Candidatus Margulisiibacteriota bacterium]
MIAYLRGHIIARDEQSVVLDVQGVGYQVYLSERGLQGLALDKREQAFYIYQHIREDANVLYGFREWQERKLFLTMLAVSGVGPKMALTVLARHSPAETVNLIYRGDAAGLGLGKKTAEKIVLELKDKIAVLFAELITDKNNKALPRADSLLEESFLTDIRAALSALGYTAKESELALRQHQAALTALDSTEKAVTYLLRHL